MSSLSLKSLSRSFATFPAVKSLSLDIQSGEFFALLGPSGCGKTTLLRIIAGFEQPDSGAVVLDGNDITRVRPQDREIGMVFQNYALFPSLTVSDNVAFGLRARHVPEGEIRTRVGEMLDSVKLGGKAGASVATLSGGEQQRVAVARALVLRPRLLLLDEPLSNLDVALRLSTREEIRSLQRASGVTTVYVTHDQSEAMSLADRIGVMRGGLIEQVGPPRDLYEDPANPFVAGFLGGANVIEGVVDVTSGTFNSGGLRLPLPPGLQGNYRGAATFVVKPEAVVLSLAGGAEGIPGRIQSMEYLGHTTTFHVVLSGIGLNVTAVSSSLPSGLDPGAEVLVQIEWSRCRLFGGA